MEPKFVIQGVDYPVPAGMSLTIGEARILGQMSKGNVAEIMAGDADFDMDVIAALMVIAYMRGNPNASRKIAEQIIDAIPLTDLNVPEADAGPPEQRPSEPEPTGSPESSGESTPYSGAGSSNGSPPPAIPLTSTGTPESATPSEDSAHATLAS